MSWGFGWGFSSARGVLEVGWMDAVSWDAQYRFQFLFFWGDPTAAPPRRDGDGDEKMDALLVIVAGAGAVNAAVGQWIGIPRTSAGQATGVRW